MGGNGEKDMKTKALRFLLVLSAFLCSFYTAGEEDVNLEKDFKSEIALYRIRPDQTRSLRQDPDGVPLSAEADLRLAVRNFYDWLYPLGPKFLKRFKIKTLVVKDTVYDRNKDKHQLYLVGDTLFMDVDLDKRGFYQYVFFLQTTVMQRSYIGHWTKINPNGFFYRNSSHGNLSNAEQEKFDAFMEHWDSYFVSQMAMHSPEYDMAETFAYLIMRGPNASAFAADRPDLQKKFNMVVSILESVKAFDPGAMETLVAEDLSALKTYSPEALSVRLFHEYSGLWPVSRPKAEDKGPAKTPSKIGDPVEVAGRKIDPLILSLETNDMRLFKLLMDHKVDPNVTNGKKICALMLAIGNNNPEQVKLLLEAGAKVTLEIARVGTASGVNTEIVKLMNAYLPGVRQLEEPEKKKTNRTSGAADALEPSVGDVYQFLRKVRIPHIVIEELNVVMAVNMLELKLKDADSRGDGIRMAVPQTPKTANAYVTINVENRSAYEILELICRKTGLKMRIDESRKTVYLEEPGTGEKSGASKEKQ